MIGPRTRASSFCSMWKSRVKSPSAARSCAKDREKQLAATSRSKGEAWSRRANRASRRPAFCSEVPLAMMAIELVAATRICCCW